ncbi:type II toxin-antitoxin system PemK/MazF family toxin [Planococcus sp. A6]|uniref:type II toxin-antitoxin system PemK/MazF family toxin n=1 Tax=Planococcus sp. A6 TaxID=2992760 RepID=UPI00237BF293|nr:type II toxin-antitoxin system PemK/MazF family toxin [Planococcus sp. A6]MDE0583237.1 type II toxin-antitoxin system PemK/MazF family toxin [Planococcus sp. A6]
MLKKKYKNLLISLRGKPAYSHPKVYENIELIKDTNKLLSELFDVVMKKDQYYGINWLVGLERYVEDHSGSIRTFNKHLSRGHIVQVELFGHFNKELTFVHPALVLYDNNSNHLLVAPISTSKYQDSDPLHIDVDTNDGIHHESGICLDAIRIVDKNRVLYQIEDSNRNKAKARPEVLDKVDLAIMEHFLPQTFKNINEVKENLEQEIQKNAKLLIEIADLKSQLAKKETSNSSTNN